MEAEPVYRYRLKFSKEKPVKYVAHLDMVIAWTRAFRRVRLPLAYTHGFNPQARIQVASSLPLGYMGSAEIMDIYLTQPLQPDEIVNRVNETLPAGFTLHQGQNVELKAPALQSQLTQADYDVWVETDRPAQTLENRISEILSQTEILTKRIRRRQEETFDLRPLLHDLDLTETKNKDILLKMRLSAGQHGNLRPDNVLTVLGLDQAWSEVTRTRLIFAFDN